MNITNNQPTPNFTAFMNTRKITNNKGRWNAISGLFESKTRSVPDTKFDFFEQNDSLFVITENRKYEDKLIFEMPQQVITELLDMPNIAIVEEFKKILELMETKWKICLATDQFLTRVIKKLDISEHSQNVINAVKEGINARNAQIIKEDEFLSRLKFVNLNYPKTNEWNK